MFERFDDPQTAAVLDEATAEMLAIRGGAEMILFSSERPELNGKTLAEVATQLDLPVPEAVRAILRGGRAAVMNLGLYDEENTRFLATRDWMMTCTDGRDVAEGATVGHPRVSGAFTRKLRRYALDEGVITLPFAIRSMSGLAADFLPLPDRGYVEEGRKADIAVLERDEIEDLATHQAPRRFSAGTVHVIVNGAFAIRDGVATGALAGDALRAPWTQRQR